MTTKTLDNKGRLMLGSKFANRTVIVDDSDENRIVVTPAVVIPQHEAWLYKNPEAMRAVALGLEQAKARKFARKSPDVDADAAG